MTDKPHGRPLKFNDPEELKNKIEQYFLNCQDPEDSTKWKTPPTITGLAYFLDTTRDLLLDYQEKDGFSDTIKRAKMRIHAFNEEQLYRNTQVTGVIFNLKNNYGWKDKNETDVTTAGQPVNFVLSEVIANKNGINTQTDSDS